MLLTSGLWLATVVFTGASALALSRRNKGQHLAWWHGTNERGPADLLTIPSVISAMAATQAAEGHTHPAAALSISLACILIPPLAIISSHNRRVDTAA